MFSKGSKSGGLPVQVHYGKRKVINKGLKIPFELALLGEQKLRGTWAVKNVGFSTASGARASAFTQTLARIFILNPR